MSGDRLAGLGPEELRAAVREVLRDVLPAAVVERRSADTPVPEQVVVRTDSDLDALVRRVAAQCADPRRRAAIQEGRHGFLLAGPDAGGPGGQLGQVGGASAPGVTSSSGSSGSAAVVRVERGAVTERAVRRAAADGARLVLGARAVMTPLARDRARALGVLVEKES